MSAVAPPVLTAYPLELAESILRDAGFQIQIKKTNPPGYDIKKDVRWRVVQQRILENNFVMLVVAIETGRGGDKVAFIIDKQECTACGLCLDVCPSEAIRDEGDFFIIDPELCDSCGSCLEECANEAIKEE